jgi:putative FmdB family regulatory protein
MPIYEYLCEKCKHEFEREQRITDDPVKTCPECRSRRVKKLISQTSFVLKGGGWYSDLYSSTKPEKEKGSDKKDSDSTKDSKSKSDTDKTGDKKKKKKSSKSAA